MAKFTIHNVKGETVGDIELSDAVFAAPVNQALLHAAVVRYLANQRQGTAKTKTRTEVRGGGRKPWRQKGTGRARHGSIRSPIWRGGGITFGPQPRDFRLEMPRKARRAALRSALSAKAGSGDLVVLDSLEFAEPKTKQVVGMLKNLKVDGKALILTGDLQTAVYKSTRNLPGVTTEEARNVNVYDILNHGKLIMTEAAARRLEEVLA